MKKVQHNGGVFSDVLSPLEQDVIQHLWPDRTLRVRDIYEKLKGKRKVALSSVAVILDRLYKKGIVDRQVENGKGGVRYLYFPVKNKDEFERSIMDDAVNNLLDKFGDRAAAYFNDRFAKRR